MKGGSKSEDQLVLRCEPIGHVRSMKGLKFDVPHQPDPRAQETSVIELLPGRGFEQALRDVSGFERIWVLWWFHKNSSWRPMVLPPRGAGRRRGVFATRSPHRPNPIGITVVSLFGVSGRSLLVGSHDLVDGTPILDLKPYIPEIDSFATSRVGWLSELEAHLKDPPRYTVVCSQAAHEQLSWLKSEWQIDIFSRAAEILARDPSPHRTRRISRKGEGVFRMGCGAWRLYFTIAGDTVQVFAVTPGYPPRSLDVSSGTNVPHREAQSAFQQIWGNPTTARP